MSGRFEQHYCTISSLMTFFRTDISNTNLVCRHLSLFIIFLNSLCVLSITENGFPVKNENSLTLPAVLEDTDRVEFYKGATKALMQAIYEDGCDIKAYFGWSESIFLLKLKWVYFDGAVSLSRFREILFKLHIQIRTNKFGVNAYFLFTGLLDNFEW